MHPFYVKHKETGDEFLVLELITAAKIQGIQVQIAVRYFAFDAAGNDMTLDPDTVEFIGLMPPPKIQHQPAQQKPEGVLILPYHR